MPVYLEIKKGLYRFWRKIGGHIKVMLPDSDTVVDKFVISIPASSLRFLHATLKCVEYETNAYMTSQIRRNQVCEELGISKKYLYKQLSKMQKAGLLIRYKGDLIVNPTIFYFGKASSQAKLIKSLEREKLLIGQSEEGFNAITG